MADQTDHVMTTEPGREVREDFIQAVDKEVTRLEREGLSRPESLTETVAVRVDDLSDVNIAESLYAQLRRHDQIYGALDLGELATDSEELARNNISSSIFEGMTKSEIIAARDWLVRDNDQIEIKISIQEGGLSADDISQKQKILKTLYEEYASDDAGGNAFKKINDRIIERREFRDQLDQAVGQDVVGNLLESIRNAHEMNEVFGHHEGELARYGVDASLLKGMTTQEMREARDWNVGENTVWEISTALRDNEIAPDDMPGQKERMAAILDARTLDEDALDVSSGRAAALLISANISERRSQRIEQEEALKEAAYIGPRGIAPDIQGMYTDGFEIKPDILNKLTPQEARDAATWLGHDTWEKREAFQDGLKAAEKIPFSDFMHKEDWGDRHPVEAHRREKLLVAVKVPDLTHDEVNSQALKAPRVQGAREKAEALGVAAYGEASGVSKMIREIDASTSPAALASEKARELRADPETFGELPGRAGGWLRGPDMERKTALAAVIELANAIDKYGVTLTYERNQVVKEHVAEQKKMAVEIPAPSNALSAVLAMPVEKQANALQNAPVVAKELETLVQASEKRLSQAERRELSSGKTQSLEDRHDTSVARANRLGKVLQQSTQLHEEHQKQVRQQSLNRNVGQALAR